MPVPVSHPHQRYSVSGYREDESGGRVAWSCDLLRHGQSFGLVAHDGGDGGNRYTFTDEARGEEFLAADVLVDELITVRQMNSLDQVAYCFAEDRFEESGEHRVADPGLTFEQVRELLATRYPEHHPRIWDKARSAMVPVTPAG
ncbi:hypothetical protein MO973_28090 [Paenibacillus sp. TRM 82003]|uniref:hypothetical protein n=1 Tax=Kineococcus sp. TRM81007 TaxID=2925831 RepID=UPI001F59237B|nr:hypothetical protein [Kineococcus sp. TRM81007]MCI2238233.1 hypothetical protein [Kineococcus sp. TRM81007]MCI3924095.1 hypothetical protein [Paenibacillus sp. TRM 82003]